jgi:DNA-binding MarR family transcriptional regulator
VEPQELAHRRAQTAVFLDLLRLRNTADRRIEERLAALGVTRITASQAQALLVLVNERAPMTAAALARSLGVSSVTVGRFVKAMEANGWVERRRDDGDQRRILLVPTAATREALPRFVAATNALLDVVFGALDDNGLASMSSWLREVHQRLADEA